MSAEDFDSWQETIYLLRSPANARRLMEAVARDKSGQVTVVKTMEELQALAGEYVRSIHSDPDGWEDFMYWLGADRRRQSGSLA
jgi:Antitoxin Phd_YefM, type II toxin-antitoxin system